MLPLDYLLAVVRDESADPARRDKLARAALPYCHARLTDAGPGKKVQQARAAKRAGNGTPWEGDLDPDDHRQQ